MVLLTLFLFEVPCSYLRDSTIWDNWTTWTECKYAQNGFQRRRFRDTSHLASGTFPDEKCILQGAVGKDEYQAGIRMFKVLYNELERVTNRVAEIEYCEGNTIWRHIH